MSNKFLGLLVLLFVFAFSQTSFAKTSPEVLAHKAVSDDASESARAVAELRALGPAGLEVLFRVHGREIRRQVSNPLLPTTLEWQRLSAALDAVSQQKDSYLSGLYWHTDFDQAKTAAHAAGKPILSLRLLGNLNEEFSCANSRFFRTILYSNSAVSEMLRENFILHWKSVRPAPHITIDFGDGRKLERTVTGNSIHYILDADGRPIDALPGLYGPRAFLRALGEADEVFHQLARPGEANLIQALSAYHGARLKLINLAWLTDIEKTGGKIPQGFVVVRREDGTPAAIEIAPLAVTKAITEASILRSMTAGADALGTVTDEALWKKIALLHIDDARLDALSIGLIQRQTQKTFLADASKTTPEAALRNLVEKLEMHIALDTVRNEYLLHTKLHAWLVADRSRTDLDRLNERVYAQLFLTPASDPWLGLFESSTYVALEGGGVVR
jgi:hypothetical protein